MQDAYLTYVHQKPSKFAFSICLLWMLVFKQVLHVWRPNLVVCRCHTSAKMLLRIFCLNRDYNQPNFIGQSAQMKMKLKRNGLHVFSPIINELMDFGISKENVQLNVSGLHYFHIWKIIKFYWWILMKYSRTGN